MAEQRKFQMHEKLLLDVIKKQAGTIDKACLEAVMNSIEAGATKVDIKIDTRQVIIEDDGKGFRSREEIEKFFETFGQPHEASEGKKWAQFRMGRGQMFAFGKNHWTTGNFEMSVDINARLGYDLTTRKTSHEGCRIVIDLYAGLSDRDIYTIQRELATQVKYVSVPIILNDKQVNSAPENSNWGPESNNDAFMRLSDSAVNLTVYNMGVLVKQYGTYDFGIGGTIVSKERLEVNFARNDIISSCPVWKRIRKVIDSSAGIERVKKKKAMNDAERINMIERFCSGEFTTHEAAKMQLFVDVTGKGWTANGIAKSEFPNWTFAERNSRAGDRLIQAGRALVLDEAILRAFDCKPQDVFTKDWRNGCSLAGWNFNPKFVKFADLENEVDDAFLTIPKRDWRKAEAIWVQVIQDLQADMVEHDEKRNIIIGLSGGKAKAWTDGESYIAFDRDWLTQFKFLKSHGRIDMNSLCSVAQVLAHELCHDTDSRENVHSPEFYKAFHDMQIYDRLFRKTVAFAIDRLYGVMNPAYIDRMFERAKKYADNDTQKSVAAEPVVSKTPDKKTPKPAPAKPAPKDKDNKNAAGRVAGDVTEAEDMKAIALQYKGNGGTLSYEGIEKDPKNNLKWANGMTAYRICKKYKSLEEVTKKFNLGNS